MLMMAQLSSCMCFFHFNQCYSPLFTLYFYYIYNFIIRDYIKYNQHKDGSPKNLKSENTRTHYHYSQKKKTSCETRYCVETNTKSDVIKHRFVNNHNHHPPEKLYLQKDIKKEVMLRLSHQQKVGNIHKDIVNSTKIPFSATVPTRKQILNINYHLKQKVFDCNFSCVILTITQVFLSSNTIKNIIEYWKDNFVTKVELHFFVNIFCCSHNVATFFALYGDTIY